MLLFRAPNGHKAQSQAPVAKKRSPVAQKAHTHIMQACQASTKEELNRSVQALYQIIKKCSVAVLLEASEHGCTAFYDALILPFKIQTDNSKWAEEISTDLWEVLFSTFRARFLERIKDVLMAVTNEGFTLLHATVYTCDSNVDKIIALLKMPGNETALQINLKSKTCNGFLVLSQAIISRSPYRARKVVALLQEPGNETALYDNLNNTTNDGFSILSQAAASGDEAIFSDVLSLLQTKGYESSLQRNLLSRTKQGFMLLQHTLITGHTLLIQKVIALLQEPRNQAALSANLNNRTEDGIGVLSHALATRNPSTINNVLTLFQMQGDTEILLSNLKRLSPLTLAGAIAGKDKANLNSVVTILKMDLTVAKANILAKLANGGNCLLSAINSVDIEIIMIIDDLIQTAFEAESKKVKIDLLQGFDFRAFRDRPDVNYKVRGYVQTIEDMITQKEFERKNKAYAKANPRMKP